MFDVRLYGDKEDQKLSVVMIVEGGRLREWKGVKVVQLDKRARNPDSPVLVFLTQDNTKKTYLRGEIKSLSDRRKHKVGEEDLVMLRKNLLQKW